ncbi:hypothetical protein SH2C18_21150 [Clostridium sediminicola]|uniref:LysM peptidoglycan-binding domain-containing protein n=1 Tax=Clostridium sediminicola TaxID=3114879 RepID=UPI0031F24DFA
MNHKKIATLIATLLLLGNTITAKASIINHTVTNGESLWKISQKYSTTTDELIELNNLASSNIYIGQTLKVNDTSIKEYTVRSGDSCWKISQQYNISVDKLLEINKLDSSNIYIGQVLYVPANISNDNKSNNSNYTVQSGDSLWKISLKFNVSVTELQNLNNLSSSSIYIGQVLKIPTSSEIAEDIQVETANYTVKSGDNLWNVAQKFNTSMDAISKSNMLATDILMPGQIITVPINSTEVVSPAGISMMKKRTNDYYGDLYDWNNARRLFTVGQTAILKDLASGISFNVKYYGGSNHADIVTLTQTDTNKLRQIFPSWSWTAMKPMVLYFEQGGKQHQLAVSVTGMPHSSTDIYNNGLDGHIDMYFYNSTSHVNNTKSDTHQNNCLKSNGQ